MPAMTIRAVAMLSGGLDSTLAVKLMANMGVGVIALNVSSPFCSCASGGAASPKARIHAMSKELGIPLFVERTGPDYIDAVRAPRFGYGKGLNPCQDCRIYTFKLARALMEDEGAQFVFTGEVLGQRPRSQQRDQLARIEREAGLERLVLRPLSALHLPPTIPEEKGWVDRSQLLDISGRSRARQLELAGLLGIQGGFCTGGGCLLTEPEFSAKVQDAFVNAQDSDEELRLLRVGRHFRLAPGFKLIVGRSEPENRLLDAHVGPGRLVYRATGINGPDALLFGRAAPPPALHAVAAALLLRYADVAPHTISEVRFGPAANDLTQAISACAARDDQIARYRVPALSHRRADVDWLTCRARDCDARPAGEAP